MLDLIKPKAITRSGVWSDSATWKDRRLPTNDANVLIPNGAVVTLDRAESARLGAIRIEGSLRFATDRDTGLLVETLLVTPAGVLMIGSAEHPIAPDKTARIKRQGRFEGSLPEELLGKTTRELWQQHRLAVAGVVAPADATTAPRINGLIGAPANYLAEVRPASVQTDRTAGFQLTCVSANEKQAWHDPTPSDLRNGWNLVTRTIGGQPRSFLIFAGEAKPMGKKGDQYSKPQPAFIKPKSDPGAKPGAK